MQINVLKTLAVTALLLAGCDQNSPPSSSAPADTPQPVYTVDSVTIEHPGDTQTAVVIKASGTVRTAGWTDAQLQAETATTSPDTIIYKLVATPPPKNTNVTQAMQPIETTLRVESIPAQVKTVRVIAETNQTDAAVATQPATPPAETQPPANQAPQ